MGNLLEAALDTDKGVHIMQSEINSVRERLASVGFMLPSAQETTFNYLPVAFHERVAYLAGQIAKVGDKILYQGRVGEEVTFEQAKEATEVTIGQALAWIDVSCGGLENVERILRMEFFVSVGRDFDRNSELADVASRLLAVAFGDNGRHPRSVIGVSRLPRHAPVLIQLTLSLNSPVAAAAGMV